MAAPVRSLGQSNRSDTMSILGNILGKIFNRDKDKPAAPNAPAQPAPTSTPVQPQVTAAVATAPQPAHPVDVAGILNFMNEQRDQKLNWQTSIVDLMKLLGMESSLAERKELADELGYTGDKSDSASMNIWLHKQVIQKIVDNGGQLPRDMTS